MFHPEHIWIRPYTSIFHVESCGHACIIARKSTECSRRCIFSSRYLHASHVYLCEAYIDMTNYDTEERNWTEIPRIGIRLCIYAKSASLHVTKCKSNDVSIMHVSRMHILNLASFIDSLVFKILTVRWKKFYRVLQ